MRESTRRRQPRATWIARRARQVARWALVLALLCAAQEAAAQGAADGVADEADLNFELGNEAYRSGAYQVALEHYFVSNRLAPNRNVLLNIALCYEKLGQYVEAYRYFDRHLVGEEDPQRRAAVQQALDRIRPQLALLEIETTPPGATLYINRRDLGSHGRTPQTLALTPGAYDLILEREGYAPQVIEDVRLDMGATREVEAELERLLGELVVTSSPPGTQVTIEDPEGEQVVVTPATVRVTPGTRLVRAEREGYAPARARVAVEAHERASVELVLEQYTGSLVVQSEEAGALVLVDGQPRGFAPTVIEGLPVGAHELVVEAEGFRPFSRTLEIEPDVRLLVEARLDFIADVGAASRTTESLLTAPASVTLISEREIDAFNYLHVYDALTGARGVFLNNDGTYTSLGVRGYSPFGQYGNRLQVQLDGHIINDDWIWSSFVAFDLMSSLENVERIELVRGPTSVLYGTSAFFGVVNVVTPTERLPRERARLTMTGVGPGALRGYATVAQPLGDDGGVWVSGGGIYAQGRDYFSPALVGSAEAPDGRAGGLGGYDTGTAMLRAWWGDLRLHAHFHQRDKQQPTGAFGVLFGDERARLLDQRWYVDARYEPELSDVVQLFSRVFVDGYHYVGDFPYAIDDGGLISERYDGVWASTEQRVRLSLHRAINLDVGAEYQNHFVNETLGADETGEAYIDTSHPFQQFSAFTLADGAPWSWMSYSAGVRFDGWQLSDLPDPDGGDPSDRFIYSINPRLALIFTPSPTSAIKLMGGRAFRLPSIYELTYNDDGFTQLPSPGLEPEVIYSGELEYTHALPLDLWATAGVYYNQLDDLIEQLGEGTEDDLLRYVNRDGSLRTLGAEVSLRREFKRGWMFMVQYSFQRTRVDDLGDGAEVANSPEHLAAAKLVAPIIGRYLQLATRLSVDGGRLDREGDRTDPAALLDAALSGDTQTLGLSYSVGVRNLLDWDHTHPVGADVPDAALRQAGRTFIFEVSGAF